MEARSKWGRATVAVGIVAAAAAAGCAPGGKRSSAEIVAKNVAARGGLAGWRKVETMVWAGHIDSAHAPSPNMPFRLEQKRPNKTRMQIHAFGDTSVRAFDGAHGWKLRQGNGRPDAQPYTPQELKFSQAGHGIDGPLIDHAAKGSSVTLEGVDEIGGRKAYHLALHPATGASEDVWVDAETYLDIRYDRMADGPGDAQQRRVSTTYGDYRTVEGLQIPFLIMTAGEQGTAPDRLQIDTVALNSPLDDSIFESPGSHPSHRGRPNLAARVMAPAAPPTPATAAREARGSVPR